MISALLLSALCAGPVSGGVEEAVRAAAEAAVSQDKKERIKQLSAQAKQADARGDSGEANRLRAEAYALTAEVLNDQGNRSRAEDAYNRARALGWSEPPPWGSDAPTPSTGPRSTPRPTPTPAAPKKDRFKKDKMGKVDPWPLFQFAPLKDGRNATWHSTLGIPPMEEAISLPKKMWNFRVGLELQSSDYSETINGETTLYHTDRHEEIFELNYGLTDSIQVGGRISMGELLQVDDDVIRIFEAGTQIIPTGDRSFAIGELVLRGKYVMMDVVEDMVHLGGLLEIKIPLADSAALFSSGTIDISLTALLTIPVSLPVVGDAEIHVNVGPVIPVGGSGLFEPDFDPNMFFHYGFGGALKLHERLTGILEIEGNTAGWSDIAVLDKPIMRVTAGGRWKIGQKAFMSGTLGMGADEISGGLLAGLSFDFTF